MNNTDSTPAARYFAAFAAADDAIKARRPAAVRRPLIAAANEAAERYAAALESDGHTAFRVTTASGLVSVSWAPRSQRP